VEKILKMSFHKYLKNKKHNHLRKTKKLQMARAKTHHPNKLSKVLQLFLKDK